MRGVAVSGALTKDESRKSETRDFELNLAVTVTIMASTIFIELLRPFNPNNDIVAVFGTRLSSSYLFSFPCAFLRVRYVTSVGVGSHAGNARSHVSASLAGTEHLIVRAPVKRWTRKVAVVGLEFDAGPEAHVWEEIVGEGFVVKRYLRCFV